VVITPKNSPRNEIDHNQDIEDIDGLEKSISQQQFGEVTCQKDGECEETTS